jgi:hypothetical protein
MHGLDEYEPFFDAVRAAYQQMDDARAGYVWAQQQDPTRSWEQHARLEQARTGFRHAVDELIAYVLH